MDKIIKVPLLKTIKNRIISSFLCVGMISAVFPVNMVQAEDEAYAQIIINDKITAVNMAKYDFSPTVESYELVKRGGRSAMLMNPSNGCHYMRYNLDNKVFPKTENGGSYNVLVDYYDEGSGFFSVRYDGVYNNVRGIQQDHNDIVRMENTKEWKSHTFYIADADFGGEWQGIDLQIALFSEVAREMSAESVIIGNVRIEKSFPKNPVKTELISDETGNIFALDDEKLLKWKFENITEVPIDINVDYKVFDEYANRYEGGQINTKIDAGSILEKEFTAPVSEKRPYGVYKVKIKGTLNYTYKGEAGSTVLEGIYDYSVADKFKEGEEGNKKLITATHIETQKHNPEKNSELTKQAGFEGLRDEFRWERIEPEKGVYKIDGDFTYPEIYAKRGQKVFFTTGLGNKFYTDSYTAEDLAKDPGRVEGMPLTDAEKEGFTNYVLAVLNKYSDNISHVEIWNEPNHQGFNPLNRPPEVYAELVKYAYPRIKAKYPDIPIGAISTAAIPFDWIEKAFATGVLDYMDAVTVHPYQWNGVFNHAQFHNDLTNLHKLMEKYGAGDKPVWATEWGFSSGTNYWGMKTTAEQARCMVQFYTMGNAYDYIDLFLLYNFQSKGVLTDDGEHNFGIVAFHVPQEPLPAGDINEAPSFERFMTPYAAKPAYLAITEMNKMIANAKNHKIYDTPEGIDALSFERTDGQKAAVLWSNKVYPENVSFNISGNGSLYDIYGNEVMKLIEGTDYTVTLGTMPMWIKGNVSDIRFTPAKVTISANRVSIAAGDTFSLDIKDEYKRNLTTVVNSNDFFKTQGMTMKDGEGTIEFISDDDTYLRTYEIYLEHYDGDKLVAVNKVNVEVIDAIDITLRGIRNAFSLDRHIVEAVITNKSTQRTYSGDCRIVEPIMFSNTGNQGRFTSLKPGESITIPLNIPRIVQKQYFDIKVQSCIDSGKVFSGSSLIRFESQLSRLKNPNVIPVYSTAKRGKPVIDGVISDGEWGEFPISVNKKESLWSEFNGWSGPEDLSFKANVMWDTENFYLCLQSKDDIHYQEYAETDMWKGDSIQFGIIEGEPDALKSPSYNEFGIALYGDEVRVYRSAQYKEQPIGVITNLSAKATRNEDGISYEIAIPWIEAMYSGFVPKSGGSAAFSIILNDNDGAERKGWIELTPGVGSGKSALKFKCIDFMD